MAEELKITKKFWDFIEENVPNYHRRDDVLRQANLQAFLDDGDETYITGITREEAVILRNRILLNLYHQAIDAFTNKLPVVIIGETSCRNYAEALVDIAYEAGAQGFNPTGNSRDTIDTIIHWANEFTRQHQDTDWNEIEYLDTIYEFTEQKLKKQEYDTATN